MNEVQDNIHKSKCNAKSPIHIKTKDVKEIKNKLIGEEISDRTDSNIDLHHVNSHLTNGSSKDCERRLSETLSYEPAKVTSNVGIVNNVEVDKISRKEEELSHASDVIAVRNLVEEALESLETTLRLVDTPPKNEIEIIPYQSEVQMPDIMRLIQKDLSEPYSIYTYRYFIHNWPELCFLAMHGKKCVGAIVCKLDLHRNVLNRGYIAMLAVDKDYRKKRIGSRLVEKAIEEMCKGNADEVVLETEMTNKPALKLYENLGFVRDKRLFRYYLNGVDALRLKLWLS